MRSILNQRLEKDRGVGGPGDFLAWIKKHACARKIERLHKLVRFEHRHPAPPEVSPRSPPGTSTPPPNLGRRQPPPIAIVVKRLCRLMRGDDGPPQI
jgi:hypothetical protein